MSKGTGRYLAQARTTTTALLLCVSGAFVLAGCTNTSTVRVEPHVTAAVTEMSVLPPDIDMARSVLREQCLNRTGFGVAIGAIVSAPMRAQVGSIAGVWSSEDQARAAGYLTTYRDDATSPFEAFGERLPDAEKQKYFESLRGDGSSTAKYVTDAGLTFERSDTGCEAESDIDIFGSLDDAMAIELFVNEVNAQTTGKAGDLQVGDELRAYAACMDESGYRVEGLNADRVASEQFGQYRSSGDAPSVKEQNLAVSDYRCQSSSGLREVIVTKTVEALGAWLIQNEQRILDLRETLKVSVERAQEIINVAR